MAVKEAWLTKEENKGLLVQTLHIIIVASNQKDTHQLNKCQRSI